MALVLAAGGLVWAAGLGLAQDPKARKADPKAAQSQAPDSTQRQSGVIVKVEAIPPGTSADRETKEKGADRHQVRLRVNTAVAWRDWVRDQATTAKAAGRKPDPKRGTESVETKGEPDTPTTEIVVDVNRDTAIELRFRSSTDEVTKGAPNPRGAAKAEESTDSSDNARKNAAGKERRREPTDRPGERLKAAQLEPGQYVDVVFRHVGASNHAEQVYVLKPIGGADTPADKAEPEKAKPARDAK